MRCRVASRPARRRLSERPLPMIRQESRGSWLPAPYAPRRFGSDIKSLKSVNFERNISKMTT